MEYNHADLFEGVADAIGERVALVCGDQRLTFAEMDEHANRLAHHLADAGVEPGQQLKIKSASAGNGVQSAHNLTKVIDEIEGYNERLEITMGKLPSETDDEFEQ